MKILLLFFALIPIAGFCQNTDTTKADKLSIGFTLSPDYCYRKLKPDASSKWIADIRNTREIPKLGYTTGFSLALRLNKRIALETGLLFSDKGEKTINLAKDWISPSGTNAQGDPAVPIKEVLIYHYYYIDFPVKMNYYLLTRRAKVFLSAGISTNFFLTQGVTSHSKYGDGRTTRSTSYRDNGFSRINPSFAGGMGFSYELTGKLFFTIEPLYSRSIISIIDAPIKGYLYSAGLNTGIYFKL